MVAIQEFSLPYENANHTNNSSSKFNCKKQIWLMHFKVPYTNTFKHSYLCCSACSYTQTAHACIRPPQTLFYFYSYIYLSVEVFILCHINQISSNVLLAIEYMYMYIYRVKSFKAYNSLSLLFRCFCCCCRCHCCHCRCSQAILLKAGLFY